MTEPSSCPSCGNLQDIHGAHALACRVASGSIDQHDSIVDGIFAQLKQACINCTKEGYESQRRPGDIFISDFDVYGDAFLDLSVISTVAPAFLNRSLLRGQLEGSKIRFELEEDNIFLLVPNRFSLKISGLRIPKQGG